MRSTVAPLARIVAAVAFATASLSAQADTFSLVRTGNLASDASIDYVDFTLTTASDMLAWTSSAAVSRGWLRA